jgi:hypothetical protein
MVDAPQQQSEDEISSKKRTVGEQATAPATTATATTPTSTTSATTTDNADSSSDAKRSKREWLAYRGVRHTRVGTGFQVSALPNPSSFEEEQQGGNKAAEKETK